MNSLFAWLDHRTGYKKFVHEALFENVPGGARWRYVWGSTLTFTLSVQFITGIFLWMAYSPSSQTAWESVYYIQNQMAGGWLLRGIHHFTAQAMNVLLVLHLMQVMIDGAYKAPREINYWFGFLLLVLVLALSLTGYLLPWDQKGYWATKVATNIMAISPFIGPQLQRLVIGGPDYGHHTLTRFFALHAGVIPALIVALLVVHIYLFRRHGLTAKEPKRGPDCAFWPDQVLKDAVACLAVLAAVLFLILKPRLFGHGELGAELGAPADASEPFSAARPEWYFLFLFQFLKYFPGGTEVWGAIFIPTVLLGILFLMPLIGRWKLGHRFNLGFLGALFAGIALLTYLAVAADRHESEYQVAVVAAERDAERVKKLAGAEGIPITGAASLLRQDPFTQGPKIFARNCASCHRYGGHDGQGRIPTEAYVVKSGDTLAQIAEAKHVTKEDVTSLNGLKSERIDAGQILKIHPPPTASDLKGFASREWLSGLIDAAQIDSPAYFGNSKLRNGKMVKFVKKDVANFSTEQKDQLKKVIAAISAEATLKSQRTVDDRNPAIKQGQNLFTTADMRCSECHQFHKKDEDATAPDLTGYGSREWLIGIITNPGHERYYGTRNDRMPKFGEDKILDARAIGLVADWLRGDWHTPAGTETVAAEKRAR